MFNIATERKAIEHYVTTNNVDDFVYEDAIGFEALDYYLTMHESVMLEFICAYLDQQNGIATPYPKLPMLI
jgi:hypothetical protein